MCTRVSMVTGSNKGIGFCVVKGLCERFDGVVYLTARDVSRGIDAIKRLSECGFQARFHQLDITDRTSIERFASHIKDRYGGIDLIVNNAAVFLIDNPKTNIQQAKEVIDMNYCSHKRMNDIMYPLLRENGRIVNVSSSLGHISAITDEELRVKLLNRTITQKQIDELVQNVLDGIESGDITKDPYFDYRVSKNAAYVLGVIQSEELSGRNISVNAVHPGFCRTDASHGLGSLTPEEGALSILYAALDAPQEMTGKYIWRNAEAVDWYDASIPCSRLLAGPRSDPTPYPKQIVEESQSLAVLYAK